MLAVRYIRAPIRYASLAAGAAAVLMFAYGQVLPLPRGWANWPTGLMIASLVGLVLTRSPARGTTRVSVAFAMGMASAILGIGAILLIGYGFALRIIEEKTSFNTFLYQVTHWWVMAYLLGIAAFVAVPGVLGLWLAGRSERRASLSSAASRFSLCGLGASGLIVVSLVAAWGYRLVLWG
jgi:hypothetical protein